MSVYDHVTFFIYFQSIFLQKVDAINKKKPTKNLLLTKEKQTNKQQINKTKPQRHLGNSFTFLSVLVKKNKKYPVSESEKILVTEGIACCLSPLTVTVTFTIKCTWCTAIILIDVCLGPIFSPGHFTLQLDSIMHCQEQANKTSCHKGCSNSWRNYIQLLEWQIFNSHFIQFEPETSCKVII